MKILLVEDDEYIVAMLVKALTPYHYKVETISDGRTGLEWAKAFDYDLLLLDVMLPKMDGISLCRQLRLEGCQTPIIMLTAKDSTSDRIMGLEVGADDYVVKPFVLSELVARIRALLRRGRTISPAMMTWEKLQIDSNTREVTYNGERLLLTPKEYSLLELFLRNPQRIFSRSDLLNRIWSSSECPGEEAVTTQIKGLRQKLKAAGMTVNLIETLYGLGYRLKEENKEQDFIKTIYSEQDAAHQTIKNGKSNVSSHYTSRTHNISPQVSPVTEKSQAEAKVMAVVTKMWEDFKQSRVEEQIELFEQVLEHLSSNASDNKLLKEAQSQAHRLAGSLGCYGLSEGSKIAREIELLLQAVLTWEQNSTGRLGNLENLIKSLKQILQQPPSQP